VKVKELREKLGKLKKEEIIKLAVEFYKSVPKAKKEDNALDSLINNPSEKKAKKSISTQISLSVIETDVNTFIENAKGEYYLYPNRIVPKKERSTWRFKVKKWYRELINTKRTDGNLKQQAQILSDLYELISEACGYNYFSAFDPFQSIGLEQREFYRSVLILFQEAEGKTILTEKGIQLIIGNDLNEYTFYSELMSELIALLDIPDLKNQAIKNTKKIILKNGFKAEEKTKKGRWSFSDGEFEKMRTHNNLVEFIFRLYASLFEFKEATVFFYENYYDQDEEIKLYVLIRILLGLKEKEIIKEELEAAIKKGIKPRERLLIILKIINKDNKLPEYM
jgi:hypothetical protein